MVPLTFILQMLCFIPTFMTQRTVAEKRLHVSAPTNPVKEDGLLAVHCQVWDLTPGEEVTLFRRTNDQPDIERLTWDGVYAVGVEERVFVAERHVSDGSLVYFLTITDVVKRDEGEYTCMVFRSKTMESVSSQSLFIQIYHFPEDPDPECTLEGGNTVVSEGDIIALNCTSREGLPNVDLIWGRNGGRSILPASVVSKDGRVYAELIYRVTRYDNSAVFVCELKSSMFPEETKSCHVGPLKVLLKPRGDEFDTDYPNKHDDMLIPTGDANENMVNNKNTDDMTLSLNAINIDRCKQECSLFESPAFTWILLTFVVGAIAAILFVIGLVLLVKLRMFRNSHQADPQHAIALKYAPKSPALRDDIYEELEGRRHGETRMYMALHLSENPGKGIVQCVGDTVNDKSKHTT